MVTTFQNPERKSLSESRKMTSTQDVETSVTTNSPSQDSFRPDDQILNRYM